MHSRHSISLFDTTQRLSALAPGACGTVLRVHAESGGADRLAALGVTIGARIRVLQTTPAFVFECDRTELAVERAVAHAIVVTVS